MTATQHSRGLSKLLELGTEASLKRIAWAYGCARKDSDEERWLEALLRAKLSETSDIAAYLLDRADQYETDSPCRIALADAARNLMLGEVKAAKDNGDLDDELYQRLSRMTGPARSVKPKAAVAP